MHPITRGLVAALAWTAVSLGATTTAHANQLDVVVLGDSYAAGSGSADGDRSPCDRSPTTWGERYADGLRTSGVDVAVRNAACSGAFVHDLDRQLTAVTDETDLVVLTIGGNDVGFAGIVSQCFVPFAAEPDRCRKAMANGRAIASQGQHEVAVRLRAIAARMRPGGAIALVSYPYLAANSPYQLGWLWYRYDASAAARSLGDLVDTTQRAAVAEANAELGARVVEFVPTKDLFAGHEPDENPFQDAPSSWIWEFMGVPNPGAIYHLKPEGNAAIAAALTRAGGTSGDFGAAR